MFKKFLHYYKNHKLVLALDLLAAFLIAITGIGYPIITRIMLNDWIPNGQINLIVIGGLILVGIYVVRMGLRYFMQYYGHVMGVKMQGEMRSDLFDKLQRLPYSYFDNHETGVIMSTMTNDLFEISELAHHGPENLLIASFTAIGAFTYLMIIDWILGFILLGAIPILFILTWVFRKKFRSSMRRSRKAIAAINARVENSISGIRVTKAFTNEKIEKERFERANQEYIDARTEVFSSMGGYFSISQFVTDFFNVLILVTGGFFLYYSVGDFNYGDYSAFVVSVSLFIGPINTLIVFIEQLENASAGFSRFVALMEEEEETIYSGQKVCENLEGELKFDHVSFRYDTSNEVLDDVSFHLEKGKTLALVGPSGGGKTTICHLIPRFYFLKQGHIYIDGVNIEEYTLCSLRENIGIVQQEVFLFGGTIKDNILYGRPDASEEEVIAAAEKANILDFINELPEGWDTEIGERGVRLSGGQKQRLSIARLFLKNPPILILDEATSALDNTTEMLIQRSLHELAKGRTCLIVAHRLSTIKSSDIIAVISQGKIMEMGDHDTLLKLNGIYAELYRLQFKTGDTEEVSKIKIG
ncbi:MAG TPA: ABC transporter ATP-binding protein [Erysipelotrichaceae bacterium]|nr:ABC transporter ATP-binding protein [Erysipelotrichaceae bacterium]